MKYKTMKKYKYPELNICYIERDDVIVTSPGTETTPKDDNDGIWDLDIG